MPLNPVQVQALTNAMAGYMFPAVHFDFQAGLEVHSNMHNVEQTISGLLHSQNLADVRHGLANVIYWGWAQRAGIRATRVGRFMHQDNGVTNQQLTDFQVLVQNGAPNLILIANIGMPQFSGISFISKILMFLNPQQYCVLDIQLAALHDAPPPKALNGLVIRQTQLPVTQVNQHVYDAWRNECQAINVTYFNGQRRVVDIERGFFHLIQNGDLQTAQDIYATA